MTKEVLVRICGNHMLDGDKNDVEIITIGMYYWKNESHYILYDEVMEDSGQVIKNTIKVNANTLTMNKREGSHISMMFEPHKKHLSSYVTPVGQLMVGISTKKMEVLEEEHCLKIHVDYSLDINYEPVSECKIRIEVCSKSEVDFRL